MNRWHQFNQLFLSRLRGFYREPVALFWVYGFPLILALGLGIAFLNRKPEPILVDIQVDGTSSSPGQASDAIQGRELLAVVIDRAVVRQHRNVALPHQLAGLGDDGDVGAQALHGFEHVAGDEDGPPLFGETAKPLLHERHAGRVDALERLV